MAPHQADAASLAATLAFVAVLVIGVILWHNTVGVAH